MHFFLSPHLLSIPLRSFDYLSDQVKFFHTLTWQRHFRSVRKGHGRLSEQNHLPHRPDHSRFRLRQLPLASHCWRLSGLFLAPT